MKKLFILAAAAMIIAATTHAQTRDAIVKNEIARNKKEDALIKKDEKSERKALRKLEGNEVSYFAKQAFYQDFGNVPVSRWERTKFFDEATFTQNAQVMKAYYDDNAKLVGTTSTKKFSAIPVKAQQFINKKYAGYAKVGVIFFDDNELNETDMLLYNTQIDDADNYFVELKKGNNKIVLQVDMEGNVSYFTTI